MYIENKASSTMVTQNIGNCQPIIEIVTKFENVDITVQRCVKNGGKIANSADPNQTAQRSSLIRVYIVCLGISVPIFRILKLIPAQQEACL